MKSIINNKAKYVLITGCQRSGTTILAACLGAHPDISMLVESTGRDVRQLVGKKYNGNKLCLYKQIRYSKRASRLGYLINRLANNPFGDYMKNRPFPRSKMSIKDYEDMGTKIIYIVRNKKDTVVSMMRRAGMSNRQSERQYRQAMNEMRKGQSGIVIMYEEFVKDNEKHLRLICDYLEIPFNENMLHGQDFNFLYNEYKRRTKLQQKQNTANN